MDVQKFIKHLPEKPRPGLVSWVLDQYKDSELGGDYLVFKRTSIELETVPICATMSPSDWERYDSGIKRHWAAECYCTACCEKFITGWNKRKNRKLRGIRIHQGDDGQNYDGFIYEKDTDYDIADYLESDQLYCPHCNGIVNLLHADSLRHGRTYQLMAVSIEVIKGYAVVMTWAIRRQFNSVGYATVSASPLEALAIDGRDFYAFSHVRWNEYAETHLDHWEPRSYIGQDFTMRRYYNYSSGNNRKVGAVLWHKIPDLSKSSAEKTGLEEYIKHNDHEVCVFAYLKYWKKHPNVENLIKSAWREIIDTEICTALENNRSRSAVYPVGESGVIDFTENKPRKMLGITKEESKIGMCWSWCELECYQEQCFYEYMGVFEFNDYIATLGVDNVAYLLNARKNENYFELPKVTNYIFAQLEKDGIGPEELYEDDIADYVQTYIDYREMLHGILERQPTHEECFPKNLAEAHNRLIEQCQIKENEAYKKKFRALAKKYAPLAYNDGELCIFVCPTESELVKEGNTLRHCVGGYSHQHCSESDVIFFVRHYRRPERSYYTLDMRMNKGKPSRVQLHGYGNERHGEHKQYFHSIPRKVLEFCEKWEKEILLPMWEQGKLTDKKERKKNGKSDSTAA